MNGANGSGNAIKPNASKLKVVVADDSDLVLSIVREMFERYGAEVHTLSSAIGLSGALKRHKPDIIILDVNMPAIRGDEAIASVKAVCPHATVVLFSDDSNAAGYAKANGVVAVSKSAPDTLVGVAVRRMSARASGRNGAVVARKA